MNNTIDIEDIMLCSIESAVFLQAVNGLIDPCNIINKDSLKTTLIEINKEYCESEGLCEICRSELKEVNESRGEHFGRESFERIMVCTRCGG